ncbi:citrate (Si)-synthase [Acidiferrimicrobium sp. IK]|uniref:citrate/2-methylcitrate synthase n=1 Tax=Acidiferrimicrobium sp. IK TaxID=2871700 RepID=UPI0021CB106E|nr:citrate/2-methylcitrate synthase [Acidiferrimicrobium sp. IK]MCU4186330.1 citrate (Si)-synthase [Acidiferrimicrobium sp. IK]
MTYDPGYSVTAAYQSAITFVDGEQGRLFYRGYPVEQLATTLSFLEVAYLLIYGDLPDGRQMEVFQGKVRDPLGSPHVGFDRLFDFFPLTAHPMMMLSAATSALSSFNDGIDCDPACFEVAAVKLLAAMPVFASHALRARRGLPPLRSDHRLPYVADFLRLCFALPGEEFTPHPSAVEAINTLLILHADHELNCSTATLRLVASSGAGFFAGVTAAINALWGHLHGGANQAVLDMLQEILASGRPLQHFVDRAKDPADEFRLMGFGHRVYKTTDARAKVIRPLALRVVREFAPDDPLLDLALRLEDVAQCDEYFLARRLYPNVDFYSGIIYRALGFPAEMFTPLFVLGRVPGWIAHWREYLLSPTRRIGRPAQLYVGMPERPLAAQEGPA